MLKSVVRVHVVIIVFELVSNLGRTAVLFEQRGCKNKQHMSDYIPYLLHVLFTNVSYI